MTATTTARRQWLRFSLATMFVAITFVALVLAYYGYWMRGRHELIARQQDIYAVVYSSYAKKAGTTLTDEMKESIALQVVTYAGADDRPAPWFLRLLGERGVKNLTIIIRVDESDHLLPSSWEEVRRAQRLFPEAGIMPFCLEPLDPDGEHNERIWELNKLYPYFLPGYAP